MGEEMDISCNWKILSDFVTRGKFFEKALKRIENSEKKTETEFGGMTIYSRDIAIEQKESGVDSK